MSEPSRKELIKSRIASLVGAQGIAKRGVEVVARKRSFGQGMLVLSVFMLAAGLYSNDIEWRAIFAAAAIVYAIVGARCIDQARLPDD